MKDQRFDGFRLTTLLDKLIPGGDGFPPASGTSCAAAIFDNPKWAEIIAQVLKLLPADIATRSEDTAISSLMSLEKEKPQLFRDLLAAVYGTYYADPSVLSVIALKTGYQHPPQPFGYVLPAFDYAVLKTAKSNPPSWRDTRI
jgi:hypothetical protein